MRFITPAQTFAEHKHRQMPVFETLGLSATTALGIGAAGAAIGGIGSLGLGIYNSTKKAPSYNPQQSLALEQQQFAQMAPQVQQFGADVYNQASQNALNLGQQFAQQGTQANIANQNLVTPGSSQQRELAQNQINSYIQGQIPLDVQQQINRQVAQNLGGGFNIFSGGGQAPQNFARNLGQTSLGLSQYGLSAAPTWQQLANSMIVSPTVGFQEGMQGTLQSYGLGNQLAASAAGLGAQQSENQYQGAMNQYGAQQAGMQGIQQGLGALGSAGGAIMNAGIMGNYLNGGLSSSAAGVQNTLSQAGFAGGQLPSYMEATGTVAGLNGGAIPAMVGMGM